MMQGGGERLVDVSLGEAEAERQEIMLMMTARQEEVEEEEDEDNEAMMMQHQQDGADDADEEAEGALKLNEEDMVGILLDAVRAIRRAREEGRQGGAAMSPSFGHDEESEEASQGKAVGACRVCIVNWCLGLTMHHKTPIPTHHHHHQTCWRPCPRRAARRRTRSRAPNSCCAASRPRSRPACAPWPNSRTCYRR